ncbi:NADH dehydrogenase [ubiquinone] 1 subunit C2 isoform X5 [Symphalangus syndactylus]|uniref:NADH dehydrogenase [ubiquinone] 1 subunit C2 isoform X5 n=1 Tax=Symphalangus syndactylus TaxID=9590 RepID=UPI003004200E
MIARRNPEPLRFLPDEARSLPPPKLTDPRLLYIGFLGYCSGLIDNLIRRRPVATAGGDIGLCCLSPGSLSDTPAVFAVGSSAAITH